MIVLYLIKVIPGFFPETVSVTQHPRPFLRVHFVVCRRIIDVAFHGKIIGIGLSVHQQANGEIGTLGVAVGLIVSGGYASRPFCRLFLFFDCRRCNGLRVKYLLNLSPWDLDAPDHRALQFQPLPFIGDDPAADPVAVVQINLRLPIRRGGVKRDYARQYRQNGNPK
jgi:hypothetical protein